MELFSLQDHQISCDDLNESQTRESTHQRQVYELRIYDLHFT